MEPVYHDSFLENDSGHSVILPITVLKLDGSPAVEGKDYRLYKDGVWDDAETGVILSEGIVLYRVPSLHFEPDEKWEATIRIATIRNGRLVSDKSIEGEKNG